MFTRHILLLLYISITAMVRGQNIVSAEYFFDADPGIGKGTAITIGTPFDSVHIDDSVSTASLPAGVHTFSIRTKTDDGKWSLFVTRSFYISLSSTNGLLNINAAEYFFDADPGIGKGKKLKISQADDSIHINDSVPTTNLSSGPHTFSARTKTSDGKWSLFETRSFYIGASGSGMLAIDSAEYFFDADPGTGKGKPLIVAVKGDSIHVDDSVATTNLTAGAHTFSVRTRTTDGKWSLFETRSFYVGSGNNGLLNVTAAEYFFDTDPGLGKGKKIKVSNSGDSIHISDSAVTTSLAPGTHTFSVRTKTSDNKWSLFETRSFFIGESGNNGLLNITAAEYFLDIDPGVGKATPLNIGTAADSIHVADSVLNVYLPGKDHFFSVRVKNSAGKWSLYESRTFSFQPLDRDRDGLLDYDEPKYGTDPLNFDTNGDYLADGVNVFTGLKPTSKDTDGDGISNLQEIVNGTSPILKDTDGDGVDDNKDPFPLDRFRSTSPPKNANDHKPPTITLFEPF